MAKLPVVLQTETTECGLACIAMIARYHGHDIDLNILRKRHLISMTGASLKSVIHIADGLQLAARPLKVCLLYTSPSPRDATLSRMPSSA